MHFRTFDKKWFMFPGETEYVLAESMPSKNGPSFTIWLDKTECGGFFTGECVTKLSFQFDNGPKNINNGPIYE